MPATTPSGWRSVYASMPVPTFSLNSLFRNCGAPHAYSTISMPRESSPAASESTLPCSREIDRDDLVGALLEQRLEPEHDARARQRRGRRPAGKRGLRGLDGARDFGGGRERDAAAQRAGRRRVDVAEAAGRAGRAFAADPVGECRDIGLAKGRGGIHGGVSEGVAGSARDSGARRRDK